MANLLLAGALAAGTYCALTMKDVHPDIRKEVRKRHRNYIYVDPAVRSGIPVREDVDTGLLSMGPTEASATNGIPKTVIYGPAGTKMLVRRPQAYTHVSAI